MLSVVWLLQGCAQTRSSPAPQAPPSCDLSGPHWTYAEDTTPEHGLCRRVNHRSNEATNPLYLGIGRCQDGHMEAYLRVDTPQAWPAQLQVLAPPRPDQLFPTRARPGTRDVLPLVPAASAATLFVALADQPFTVTIGEKTYQFGSCNGLPTQAMFNRPN